MSGAIFVKVKVSVKISASSDNTPAAQFSTRADEVFRAPEKIVFAIGKARWPDLYAILEIARDASSAQISESITDLAAQILAVNLARGAGERLKIAAPLLPLMRPILLDASLRAKYDAQLLQHQKGASAIEFGLWCAQNLTLKQRAQQKARSWLQRVRQNIANDPYL